LAATDEKDFPTTQPPTQANPRIPRAHGHTRWPRGNTAAPSQGAQTAGSIDPGQTAGLSRTAAPAGLSAADRLHRRTEFLWLQREGFRSQTTHFVIYAIRSPDQECSRLGITVSRRIGGAVVRNRVKRRVRECFRLVLRSTIPAGTSMIVIARGGAGSIDYATINAELRAATLSVGRRL